MPIPPRLPLRAERGSLAKLQGLVLLAYRHYRATRCTPSDSQIVFKSCAAAEYHGYVTRFQHPPHMSTVFYRKWRPTRFSDVVGQQHITDTLRRAVTSNRVAHAYLFTGPRGVGKTSTARILAKAINAELDPNGDPLPDTDTAIAIDEGRYMDLIEIDAASNRGVGDMRELRERVLLRPTVGEFKVYIIDEVHMLTTEAFNALLKTLEEPPPQVVMILATTDIHRVPATIISRCQRFDFRRLTNVDVIERLSLICDVEEIECEPSVLELVAQSAWGSLRDAENLLEQLAVSHGTGEITESHARELLGIGDTSSARDLAGAVLKQDTKRALEIIEEEASRGAELRGLREGTINALRGALLAKHGIASLYGQLGDAPELEDEAMQASTDQMLHAITIFGRNERFGEASSPLSLEIAALRAIAPPPKPQAVATSEQRTARQPARAPQARQTARPTAATPATTQPASTDSTPATRILEEIDKAAGPAVRTAFAQVNFIGPDDGMLILQPKYSSATNRLRDIWMNDETRTKLRPAFQAVYGAEVRVQLRGTAGSPTATQPSPQNTPNTRPSQNNNAPATQTPARPAPTPTQFNNSTDKNRLADDGQSLAIPDEIDKHPAVNQMRNLGGRIVGVE